jgi:muramoyltetrapeptide carboxypeptidase
VIRLRRLKPGDRVALVAPASSFPPEEVEAGVVELARLGVEAVYDPSIFDKERFVAGSVQTRVDAIHRAWADPGIAALIAMRGGYGSAQLLPLLDTQLLRSSCKPLIGYSDITALLSLYLQNGLTAIHGPMIDRRLSKGPGAYHEDSFRRVVMTAEPAGELRPDRLETLHPGSATGVLAGGTLTQLMASMGTPWAFEAPADCVLFLEDIGERPYRIHRLLTQAAQAGVLARARAIVFGEFPGCDEPGGDPAIKDVLREFTAGFRGPVLFNFPSGHTTGPTWTVPFGVRAEVTARPSPVVRILEAAVH